MTLSRQTSQKFAFAVLTVLAVVVVVPIVLVVAYIVVQGIGAISWEFLTTFPSNGMKEGGILPALVGTVVLTFATAWIRSTLSCPWEILRTCRRWTFTSTNSSA